VILDLGLPDVDGLELLRRIRHREESLPIVVLSSRGDEAGKVAARVAVVPCTSAIRLLPTSSSGSPSGSQLPRETRVLPVCSTHWNHK
jgi:CheY-like chemotaxis protein